MTSESVRSSPMTKVLQGRIRAKISSLVRDDFPGPAVRQGAASCSGPLASCRFSLVPRPLLAAHSRIHRSSSRSTPNTGSLARTIFFSKLFLNKTTGAGALTSRLSRTLRRIRESSAPPVSSPFLRSRPFSPPDHGLRSIPGERMDTSRRAGRH